jgi:hypothetical protein
MEARSSKRRLAEMTSPDPRFARTHGAAEWCLALGVLLVFCVYLTRFVPVGWIPHDEGTLGQAADRVLAGQIPHLDYNELYSGGLSRIYAVVFRIFGVDLLHLRWAVFALDVASLACIVFVLSRWMRPIAAAAAAVVAGIWSFPNYVAPLPSWWLLLMALVAVCAFLENERSGRWTSIALMGLAAGGAVVIKQTGAYVAMGILWALLFEMEHPSGVARPSWVLLRYALALIAIGFTGGIMGLRLWSGSGAYFALPLVACAIVFVRSSRAVPSSDGIRFSLRDFVLFIGFAALPLAWLVWPYVLHERLGAFFYGALVLPTGRLAHGMRDAPPARFLLAGIPFLLLLTMDAPPNRAQRRVFIVAAWLAAILVPIASRWNFYVYQFIWQGGRALIAALPVVICHRLWSNSITAPGVRRILFMCAVVLSWLSLNQYPFAAPIYFAFVVPFGFVAAIAFAHHTQRLTLHRVGPLGMLFGLFGLLCLNPSHERSFGKAYDPVHFTTPLDLPRAHLMLTAAEATEHRAVVNLIQSHLGSGSFVAGPDTPDLYFLIGRFSPANTFFDFLDARATLESVPLWRQASVIVINHNPGFSEPLSSTMRSALAQQFAHSERIGRYEIRWR